MQLRSHPGASRSSSLAPNEQRRVTNRGVHCANPPFSSSTAWRSNALLNARWRSHEAPQPSSGVDHSSHSTRASGCATASVQSSSARTFSDLFDPFEEAALSRASLRRLPVDWVTRAVGMVISSLSLEMSGLSSGAACFFCADFFCREREKKKR